jgi:hypothetical protein
MKRDLDYMVLSADFKMVMAGVLDFYAVVGSGL